MDLRFEFARDWRMMYLSHLDLMRVFARAIRRGAIPVKYSDGFNPHADMVFGLPLQVGVTADAECLDIGLESEADAADVMARLTAQLPPGLFIRAAAEKKSKTNAMAMITHASYVMRVAAAGGDAAPEDCGETGGGVAAGGCVETADGESGGASANGARADGTRGIAAALARAVEAFLAPGPRYVNKETKKTSREIDIAPLIRSVEARGDTLIMTVSAGSVDNVKPDLVLEALNKVSGETDGGWTFRKTSLHRTGIYVERDGMLLSPLKAL